jgi:putative ABC transport system substrate-binding protein
MRRRDVLGLLGAAVAARPRVARAQPQVGKTVSIGILAIEAWPPIDTFRQALSTLGYVEGKNARFEHRYAQGRNERFPELADDLIRLKVDVILTWGTEAAMAAKQATATIPIVMGAIGDPIGSGIVSSLARPAANITGFSSLAAELEAKRLELLKEMAPRLFRVAILFNPTNRYMPLALHTSVTLYEARDAATLGGTLERLTKDRPDAFMVLADPFLVSHRDRIAQFAIENRLPSAYTYREHVEAGGLIAYTPNYHDLFRRAAVYVDKILKGTKPGELPIEQPTKFDLVINLKTARALGLTVPQTLLVAADEVIE